MSIQGTPTSGIRWLIDANGRIVGYRNPVSDQDVAVATVDATNTAAQLDALAAAGGLTPYATYVASDANPPYQLWARSASELVSPSGASLITVSYPGAVGSLVEV